MPPQSPTAFPSTVNWRKASYSASQTACVEVAHTGVSGAIRDTKHRGLGALAFPQSEWRAFLSAVKDGGL